VLLDEVRGALADVGRGRGLQAAKATDRKVRKSSMYCHAGLRAMIIALCLLRVLTCDADLRRLGALFPRCRISGHRADAGRVLNQHPPHLPLRRTEMLLLP